MTARQFAARIRRHRGKVEAPVIVREDVHYLIVEKQDLLAYLMAMPADTPTPLVEVCEIDSVLRIDAALKGDR